MNMGSDVIHTEEDEPKWIRTWVRRVTTHAAITRSAHVQAYHNRDRAQESYISITREMGKGRTGELDRKCVLRA